MIKPSYHLRRSNKLILFFLLALLISVFNANALNWQSGALYNRTIAGSGRDPALLAAIANNNGTWVTGGIGSKIFSSTNTDSWSRHDIGSGRSFRGIVYGSGRWISVGTDGIVGVSSNGISWNFSELGNLYDFRSITFGENTYIAVGVNNLIVNINSQLQADFVRSNTGEHLNAVAYGSSRFVAVGNRGTILYSNDGSSWFTASSGTIRNLTGIAYGDGRFIAVGDFGNLYSSSNGIEWSNIANIDGSGLNGIGYAGGKWYIVGGEGRGAVFSSSTRLNWTRETIPNVGPLNAITFGGGKAVAVGSKPTSGNSNYIVADLLSEPQLSVPIITSQPISRNVAEGNSVSFSVSATGNPTPNFQWRKNGFNISGATASILQISNVNQSDAGNYSVRVSNSVGSVTSQTVSLTVEIPLHSPENFTLLSPQNMSSFSFTGDSLQIGLDWENSLHSEIYEVYIEKGDSTPDVLYTTRESSNVNVSFNNFGTDVGTWYWKIIARNSSGQTSSATYSFEITEPIVEMPGDFSLVSPNNNSSHVFTGSNLTLLFDWENSDGATSYDLFVQKDNNNPTTKYKTTQVSSAEVNFSDLSLDEGTWFWKVVAKNSRGESSSQVFRFNIQPEILSKPEPFSLSTPAEDSMIIFNGSQMTLLFQWENSMNATNYDVFIEKGNPNPSRLFSTVQTPKIDIPFNDVNTDLGQWYWKVVARNDHGIFESSVFSLALIGPEPFRISIQKSQNLIQINVLDFVQNEPLTLWQSYDLMNWGVIDIVESANDDSHVFNLPANEEKVYFRVSQQLGENSNDIPRTGSDYDLRLNDEFSMKLLWVEPGTFMMGSPENEAGRNSDEMQHEVNLTEGFWLGETEVTQGQWQSLMGNNPSSNTDAGLNAPVEQVSWIDTQEFIEKLNTRERTAGRLKDGYEYALPTEAQWEYACRAGTQTRFYWGDSSEESVIKKYCWYETSETQPVGNKLPNAWGLYDMSGNVYEWCQDWYDSDYPFELVTDPFGPASGSLRVIRGSTWFNDSFSFRSAHRNHDMPSTRGFDVGFRLSLRKTITPSDIVLDYGGELTKAESIKMIWVEPGTFMMGSPIGEAERNADERQHQVTLTDGFWLGETEVTQGQWESLMGNNPSYFKNSGKNAPVDNVSWEAAYEFIGILNAREGSAGRLPEGYEYALPTEAQWEYACRAETQTMYYWGDSSENEVIKNYCWFSSNADESDWSIPHASQEGTQPVGNKLANAWGFYDMSGNVLEWCEDRYGEYLSGPAINPVGPTSGSLRILRGGAWTSKAVDCRSANRTVAAPSDAPSGIFYAAGFRISLRKSTNTDLEAPEGMVYIPAGTFNMGDHWDVGSDDELPVHEVFVSGFYMDQYEVTKARWDEVYDWAVQNGYDFDEPGSRVGPDYPVEVNRWYDAVKWANARSEKEGRPLVYFHDTEFTDPYRQGRDSFENVFVDWDADGYRLPTEAEWEKAARGGLEGHQYPWASFGANYEQYIDAEKAIYDLDLFEEDTVAVGSYSPNGYGLYDMAGNVWEWCWDRYNSDYYKSTAATEDNPKGPDSGSQRILRGGGWSDPATYLRVAMRGGHTPYAPVFMRFGFRLVSGQPQVE